MTSVAAPFHQAAKDHYLPPIFYFLNFFLNMWCQLHKLNESRFNNNYKKIWQLA